MVVLLNSDIILTQSFVEAVVKVRAQFSNWFLMGARIDLTELPPMFEPSSSSFDDMAVNMAAS